MSFVMTKMRPSMKATWAVGWMAARSVVRLRSRSQTRWNCHASSRMKVIFTISVGWMAMGIQLNWIQALLP